MDHSLPRRAFLLTPALAAAQTNQPVNAHIRPWHNKPTLYIRNQPTYASFYALTDCIGGRFSFEEGPRHSIRQFVDAGFKLFQLDLFLADYILDPTLARRQIKGITDLCPDAAVVLRWHLNVPESWKKQNPDELTRYANGDFENLPKTVPVRYIQDDLRRTPRASLASEKWMQLAREKTVELLKTLAKTPEAKALAGIHVACGVYGEWHYWGFMRNEPDVSRPMQQRFDAYRKAKNEPVAKIPTLEERKALDDGIFRDPQKREAVIDYYRCQQELVAERIIELCRLVKQTWRAPILTGTFYGYFFSMFNRQVTGGHLELHKILQSPHVDYLSAPQAYGTLYRDMGGSGITRALIETIRLNGKLFLDEMDETPSWKWQNNVDTAFQLTDVPADIALIRRNVLESFTRGAGLWYYDFGPGNQSGWWADTRLIAEIKRLKELLEKYHQRDYAPAGDVLFVFDTEVYYYTGSTEGADSITDPLAVNRTMGEAWRTGAAIETIHLKDLEKIDLSRFKVVVFANTWLMSAAQRKFVREKVHSPNRRLVFQGFPAYTDGRTLNAEFTREVTAGAIIAKPPITTEEWRKIFTEAGAHLYLDHGEIIHAGGGLILIHTKAGGRRRLTFRANKTIELDLPPKSSWLFDAATGERLL